MIRLIKRLLLYYILKILRTALSLIIIIHYKLWKYPIAEDGIIASVIPTDDLYIKGIKYNKLSALHIKAKTDIYYIKTLNGHELRCTKNHLLYLDNGCTIAVQNLRVNDRILTDSGISHIRIIKKTNYSEFVFDCTVNSKTSEYFSNGILSHNSIVSAIFIVWYLLNNYDKAVVCTSATSEKVKELLDKIDTILLHLPFYMKLGVEIDNVTKKKYDNGCKLIGETATDISGAGNTASLLYCDEFALIDADMLKVFYSAVFPTLSSSKTSKMIITSTARGLNLFATLYNDAISGKNYLNPIRTDWWEVDGRDEEWKKQEIANLGSEAMFNQEYGNQFSSGSTLLFSASLFRKIKKYEREFKTSQLSKYFDIN